MKDRIELLVKLGLEPHQAEAFCRGIYQEGANNTKKYNDDENWREDYETIPFDSLIE